MIGKRLEHSSPNRVLSNLDTTGLLLVCVCVHHELLTVDRRGVIVAMRGLTEPHLRVRTHSVPEHHTAPPKAVLRLRI